MKRKYDWAQLSDTLAVVFTTDESGQQEDEIASGTPEWAERLSDALNAQEHTNCSRVGTEGYT